MVVTLPQMEFHSRPPGTSAACGKGPGPRGLSSPRPLAPTQPSVYLAVMNGGGFGEGLGGARRVLRADGAGEGAAALGRAAGPLSVSAQASVLCPCKESTAEGCGAWGRARPTPWGTGPGRGPEASGSPSR